jgi:hypothetical protein
MKMTIVSLGRRPAQHDMLDGLPWAEGQTRSTFAIPCFPKPFAIHPPFFRIIEIGMK